MIVLPIDGASSIVVDMLSPESPPVDLLPPVIVVVGGGGKEIRSSLTSKYFAHYRLLAEHLAGLGYVVAVPSRRGDPDCRWLGWDRQGTHTHRRQVEEIKATLDHIRGPMGQPTRAILITKSAGGGVGLAFAAQYPQSIAAIGLWCPALRTSEWFRGPRGEELLESVFGGDRQIKIDRKAFCADLCDAIEHVGVVHAPLLIAGSMPDAYAQPKIDADRWTDPDQLLQLAARAVWSRQVEVRIIKGAEHTMDASHPRFPEFLDVFGSWCAARSR